MIYEINSDFPNFKPIEFNQGVNVILAEKVVVTTNSVGKSLLLECINYVLGAEYSRSKLKSFKELQGYSITLKMKLNEEICTVKRKICKTENSDIYINNQPSIKLKKWKDILLEYYFDINKESSILTWRNLFRYFFQTNSSNDFNKALKSYDSDNSYKTSLLQSFLISIATKEIEDLSEIEKIKSEKISFNRYLNTVKKSFEMIPEIISPIDNLDEINSILSNQMSSLKLEMKHLKIEMNLTKSRINQLSDTMNELTKNHPNNYQQDFKTLYSSLENELGHFVEKTFEQAQKFHGDLVNENLELVKQEISERNIYLYNLKTKWEEKQLLHKKILDSSFANDKKFDDITIDNFILNKLVLNGGNRITSIIDNNIKVITSSKPEEINKIISKEQEEINKYKFFLTSFVNSIYKDNRKVDFDISYDKSLKINFSYPNDSGTGKGNMKIIIYYIFLLLLNKKKLGRNIDFLILDTDITDGIDTDNLYDLLNFTDQQFKKHNLQLIITLRNDRNIDLKKLEDKQWIKHRLTDHNNGFLFKKDLT